MVTSSVADSRGSRTRLEAEAVKADSRGPPRAACRRGALMVRPPISAYVRQVWRTYSERQLAPYRCPALPMSACPPSRHATWARTPPATNGTHCRPSNGTGKGAPHNRNFQRPAAPVRAAAAVAAGPAARYGGGRLQHDRTKWNGPRGEWP